VTVLSTILLILGMGVVGVRIIFGLLTPLASAVVTRTLPETAWDGAMLLFAQGITALATFLVGTLAIGLPWYAALIAAFIVGITSYAVRAPSEASWQAFETAAEHIPRRDEREDQDDPLAPKGEAACPVCGKTFPNPRYRDRHLATKHPTA
jgi:MFS family permease